MNLNDLINEYMELGYKRIEASSKVCQDIILNKISECDFKNNITIKGGVVMHNISKDVRRATRDLDLDFIKYSLADDAIINFISKLNKVNDGIIITIIGNIEKLHHQDYDGKRLNISLKDNYNNIIDTKLDIGVNKFLELEQEEMCFDLSMLDNEITLLANSCEQIFSEKLKSLLKFGIRSTRYKDIFDFYYLIKNKKLDKEKLIKCFDILIYKDDTMNENNIEDIIKRLDGRFNNVGYRKILGQANNNWLGLSVDEVTDFVIIYFKSLSKLSV